MLVSESVKWWFVNFVVTQKYSCTYTYAFIKKPNRTTEEGICEHHLKVSLVPTLKGRRRRRTEKKEGLERRSRIGIWKQNLTEDASFQQPDFVSLAAKFVDANVLEHS